VRKQVQYGKGTFLKGKEEERKTKGEKGDISEIRQPTGASTGKGSSKARVNMQVASGEWEEKKRPKR